VQFAEIHHFQDLFSTSWPAATISDTATTGTLAAGGATGWNYGSDYGGPTTAEWTSGASTVHDGGMGMYGTYGVDDENYDTSISMCTDSTTPCRG